MGHDNVFTRMMQRKGLDLASAFIDMDSSPIDGINGVVKLDSLIANGVQLDTIRVNVKSDSLRTDFTGQIRNNRHNPQYVFNALFGGTFYERGLYFGTRVLMPKNVWAWLSVSRLQWKTMASCSLLAADKTPYWVIRNFL